MSIESWKEEYYPFPAYQVTKEHAVAHSIKKWEGLRSEALVEHGLLRSGSGLYDLGTDTERFSINVRTCSLCQHYYYDEEESFEEKCFNCPLYKVRGNVACDDEIETEDEVETDSPYYRFTKAGDPEPMIDWLYKAAEYEREHNKT